MDELELLKQRWQSRMLLKKSSSIIKWIFLISIGELLFWTILAFFVPESSKEINEGIGLKTTFVVVNIVHYSIFIIFIYLFYKNYRSIEITDTVKDLMKNILNTRRTVKHFVIYNVGASTLFLIGVNLYYFTKKDELYSLMVENYKGYGAIPQESFTSVFFISQLLVGLVLIGLILLFYRLIYGILLKRLKHNYNELEKMEM